MAAPSFAPAAAIITSIPGKQNGFYNGPRLIDAGLTPVIDYFDALLTGNRVQVLGAPDRSGIKLVIEFHADKDIRKKNETRNGDDLKKDDDPRNILSTEIAFVREPDDWGGYDHHIIASTQYGCSYGCRMCIDSLPGSWRGNLATEQMIYAAHRIIQEADRRSLIHPGAQIRLLQLGSGDPFANAKNTAPFIRNVHLVDGRIKNLYTSTAGAINNLPLMIDAAREAKRHGVEAEAQFSTHVISLPSGHAIDSARRNDLIPNPPTTSLQQMGAARAFHEGTGNNAYVNYMVVPAWNNSEADADLLAEYMPPGCTLKVVALNSVQGLNEAADDKGNMYVLKEKPALKGAKDVWENPINQILIPEFLQVDCTRADVLRFHNLVRTCAQMRARINDFHIISPIDKADAVEASCGSVGSRYFIKNAPSKLVQIHLV